MTIDEMIAVLQAAKAGKSIECMPRVGAGWQWEPATPNLRWNFITLKYRVKPEPRRVWVAFSGHRYIACLRHDDARLAADDLDDAEVAEFVEVLK